MGVSELVKDIKKAKGKNATVKAMNFLATPSGAKMMMGALKTKEKMDKKLRSFWDFVGLPSFSDNEKVERAIGRVGQRLREIENEIGDLDEALDNLESRMREWRKPVTAPSPEPKPAPVLQLVKEESAAPKAKPQPAKKPVAKAKAKPAVKGPTSKPAAKPKKPIKPFATRPVTQAAPAFKSPLLNLKLKK